MIATIPELVEIAERIEARKPLIDRVHGKDRVRTADRAAKIPAKNKGRATSVFRELMW